MQPRILATTARRPDRAGDRSMVILQYAIGLAAAAAAALLTFLH